MAHPSAIQNSIDQRSQGQPSQFQGSWRVRRVGVAGAGRGEVYEGARSPPIIIMLSTMKRSSILCWAVLLALLATTTMAGNFSCSSAVQSSCGTGICIDYKWSNSSCVEAPLASACAAGQRFSNASASCQVCANLPQSTCNTICSDYYFAAASGNSTGNSTGNSAGGCLACSATYGQGCSACSGSACTACATSKLALAGDGSHCQDTLCKLANCFQCADAQSCAICRAGFTTTAAGLCEKSACSVPYCTNCKDSQCIACGTGYKPVAGNCEPTCDPNCDSCIAPNNCAKCKADYALDSKTNTCKVDCRLSKVTNCFQCTSLTICSVCVAGYQPVFNGAGCYPICSDSFCKTCSKDAATCDVCKDGYKITGGLCKADKCTISNCAECLTASSCKTCSTNFALASSGTVCEPACLKADANCQLCSSATACSFCKPGYMVPANNGSTCVKSCSISNCGTCMNANTCQSCEKGYRLSSGGSACSLQCSVTNCDTCTASSCTACIGGYALTNDGTCQKSCKEGFVNTNPSGVTCQSCSAAITKCTACSYDGGAFICSRCSATYYLAGTKCAKCSDAIADCLLCTDGTTCSSCKSPAKLQKDGTCATITCKVASCVTCLATDSSKCETCVAGFTLNPASTKCDAPACAPGLSLINGVCGCAAGTVLSGSACVACSDSKCTSCSASGCDSCAKGYYPLGTACLECPESCDVCASTTTGSVCSQCSKGFTLMDNGKCSSLGDGINAAVIDGVFVTCEPGCAACTPSPDKKTTICVAPMEGYTFAEDGSLQRCDPSCAACAPGSPTTCTACFIGSVFSGGSCLDCQDPFGLSCLADNLLFSLSCFPFYTASASTALVVDGKTLPATTGGTCTACADFCLKCDGSGAYRCDPGQCQRGYVQLEGTANCTACFNSCSFCDSSDLNVCIDCGARRYKTAAKTCAPCPTGCKKCTSATECTSCLSGYTQQGTKCLQNPVFPCSTTDLTAANTCTLCFGGYSYSQTTKVCEVDLTCNTGSKIGGGACVVCPYGYYLSNSKCETCPTITGCTTCSASDKTACALCKKGYYLKGTTCQPCASSCADCSSDTYCNEAAPGYYISINLDGSGSGQAQPCKSPCVTCVLTSTFCLSCAEGYAISGSICQSNNAVKVGLVLGASDGSDSIFSEGDDSDVKVKKCMRSTGRLTKSFCRSLPDFFRAICASRVRFTSFRWGSMLIDSEIDTTGSGTDSGKIASSIASAPFDGASVLKVSATDPASTSSSETNLGLILGVSIPLGILLFLIIGAIVLAKTKNATPDEATAGRLHADSEKDFKGQYDEEAEKIEQI